MLGLTGTLDLGALALITQFNFTNQGNLLAPVAPLNKVVAQLGSSLRKHSVVSARYRALYSNSRESQFHKTYWWDGVLHNMVGLFFVVLSLFLSLSLVMSLSFLLLLIDFGLWGFTPLTHCHFHLYFYFSHQLSKYMDAEQIARQLYFSVAQNCGRSF